MAVRKRERFFALFGAILFLITACAFGFMVIWSMVSSKNSTDSASTTQTSCSISQATAPPETLPAPFQPGADVTTLQTTDLSVGSGKTAKAGDCVTVKYYGTLAADGSVFDENFDKSEALQFLLGKGQVIQGWDEGVVGMKVGGIRRLVIPSDLAYGNTAQGSIPANADLVFVVHLLNDKEQ